MPHFRRFMFRTGLARGIVAARVPYLVPRTTSQRITLVKSTLGVTRKMATGGTGHLNRLATAKSPYLRQHATNPVDWYPFEKAALDKAKAESKVIFLSIGYSACHWCHVMERESFEREEVAELLNADFVSIKVDREERPDIDQIYMTFVQASTGHGGWPLNVFLTPNLEPIFGGTYFAGPESAGVGRPGFTQVLSKIASLWRSDPERAMASGKSVIAQLRTYTERESGDGDIDTKCLGMALKYYTQRFDPTNGGFGTQPKFPTPVNLGFLLQLAKLKPDFLSKDDIIAAEQMAMNTLQKMALGGIHDHIGHGFARYSVTRDWSLPHFEKMLYDQGQLMQVYLDGYLLSKNPLLLATVQDIAEYLISDAPAHKNGGFYSAEDADSLPTENSLEKKEGAFYVWTRREFDEILGEDADIAAKYWNVYENGNVDPRHDIQDELEEQNVLAMVISYSALAQRVGKSTEEVEEIIHRCRAKLLAHRLKYRPRPHLDNKIVTSWNGLAIAALARASAALRSVNPEQSLVYLEAARNAASFIKQNLYDDTRHTLKRVFLDGPGDTNGFSDDYAFLISGLIELYQATFHSEYLQWANTLQQAQLKLLWDNEAKGFFRTSENPEVILRLKDEADSAEPSANSISSRNLLRLGSLLGDRTYDEKAVETCQAFSGELEQSPWAFPAMLMSVVGCLDGMHEVVVVGKETDEMTRTFLQNIWSRLLVNTVVIHLDPEKPDEWLLGRTEVLKDAMKIASDGRPFVIICEGYTCGLPIFDLEGLNKTLD